MKVKNKLMDSLRNNSKLLIFLFIIFTVQSKILEIFRITLQGLPKPKKKLVFSCFKNHIFDKAPHPYIFILTTYLFVL